MAPRPRDDRPERDWLVLRLAATTLWVEAPAPGDDLDLGIEATEARSVNPAEEQAWEPRAILPGRVWRAVHPTPAGADDAPAFRTGRDIAILRVDGLGLSPLPMAPEAEEGAVGAVLGFPGAGDFSAVPARLGTTGEVTSVDSYGEGPIRREMTSFRGEVASGNSGGPFVDGDGRVRTTVFAATVDAEHREGLGIPNDLVTAALGVAGTDAAGTGPCL